MTVGQPEPNSFDSLPTEGWTSLLYDLEARLTALASHGGGYLVLNVARVDDPFVQYLVDGAGSIEAEASSTLVANEETQERRLVDRTIEHGLLHLGWMPPDADPLQLAGRGEHPNFHRSWADGSENPVRLFAELGIRTLVEAFGVGDPSLVRARDGYLLPGELPCRA